MEDLERVLAKLLHIIQLEVNNLHLKATANVLQPEHQEALIKYYKLLTDTKLQAKERELEEKIKRAEEVLNRGPSK